MANVKCCDLCMVGHNPADEPKLVESKYRWGYKGGFKLDLCDWHGVKKNNPLTGLRKEEAEKKFWSMKFKEELGR